MKKIHYLADITVPTDPYEKIQHKYSITKRLKYTYDFIKF